MVALCTATSALVEQMMLKAKKIDSHTWVDVADAPVTHCVCHTVSHTLTYTGQHARNDLH